MKFFNWFGKKVPNLTDCFWCHECIICKRDKDASWCRSKLAGPCDACNKKKPAAGGGE